MAIANKISTTAMSTNRAKVCIYPTAVPLHPGAAYVDLPFDIAKRAKPVRGEEPRTSLFGRRRAFSPSLAAIRQPTCSPLSPQRERGFGGEGQLSLDAIVGLSYAALPDDATRAAAASLAALGATPLDWEWEAMAAVWATHEDTTAALEQALVASGLVDYDAESGRYSLHQTVRAFLARRADPAVYSGTSHTTRR